MDRPAAQATAVTLDQIAALLADLQLAAEAGRPAADAAARHPAVLQHLAPAPQAAPPQVVYLPAPAPAPARPVGQYLAVGAGAAAVLIPTLFAAAAAFLAVGLSAVAIALCALVVRWIIRDMRQH